MSDFTPDAKTRVYGVLGYPVRHSRSPAILNTAFRFHKLNATYVAFETEDTGAAIRAARDLGLGGLSVTLPHKVRAMEFVDRVDESASRVGCLNTILNQDGTLTGFNFDGIGALLPLDAAAPGWEREPVLVLGAGGGARGIALAMALDSGAKRIDLVVRAPERARPLAEELRGKGVSVAVLSFADLAGADLDAYGLLLNTTPVGMSPKEGETPWPLDRFGKKMVVYDIVYNPLETRLLREAAAAGRRVLSGDGMFLGQASLQFRLWTGLEAPLEAMGLAFRRSFGIHPGECPMQLKTLPDRILIHLSGEIDSRNSSQLKTDILDYIKDQSLALYLDLREVRYIDSGAVNLIMAIHRAQEAKGLKLYLQNLTPTVDRVLKLGNLEKILNIL
ncbi:MAG: shikimate dehydrogenase [Spirochaetes bacterium]|nr:shikimate dehydrogenase [Spirochaetota bacterium]